MPQDLFYRLEEDVRVTEDTNHNRYYNAPHADRIRTHYENLPQKLRKNGIATVIPWLYNYNLDFRFR